MSSGGRSPRALSASISKSRWAIAEEFHDFSHKMKLDFTEDEAMNFGKCSVLSLPKLIALRLFNAVFLALTLIYGWFEYKPQDRHLQLLYLTQWTNTTAILFFITSSVLSLLIHTKAKKSILHRILPNLICILLNVAYDGTIVISFIFWTLIYPYLLVDGKRPTFDESRTSVVTHGVSAVMVAIDIFISKASYRIGHLWITYLFSTVWHFVTFLYYIGGGKNFDGTTALYPILDWARPKMTLSLVAFMFLAVMPVVRMLLWQIWWFGNIWTGDNNLKGKVVDVEVGVGDKPRKISASGLSIVIGGRVAEVDSLGSLMERPYSPSYGAKVGAPKPMEGEAGEEEEQPHQDDDLRRSWKSSPLDGSRRSHKKSPFEGSRRKL